MTKHIALLRAVNVGGTSKVTSAELKSFFHALGFNDALTLLNSGNVVFSTNTRKTPSLEKLLAAEAKKRLGLDTDFMLRDAKQWRTIVFDNPFPTEARSDPARLLFMALTGTPEKGSIRKLEMAIPGGEKFVCRGNALYIFYPNGTSKSKLSVQLINRHLGVRATGRNWNTVLKLLALVEA
jgi:uncharacterized protein (DUF1697 family)